ncbi:cytochrome b/b6 domain-containing protein [Streptomyces sp. NPDC001941]|uniref:cytochrome b/b6 domain-containing protein n=1 Tax=Streptomyces sp. NPDC001941 TaxID=3154659 RepID=UPI00332BDD2F
MTSTPGSAGPTAAPTSPRPEHGPLVRRFGPVQRWAHRTTALLMLVCVATAACLYVPQLAELVGRRYLVVTVHQWAGLLLPVPVLVALLSRDFRADLRRLNRLGSAKFHRGQKLYAAWIAGAVVVMLGTGLLMWFTDLAGLMWRTSATFVHDWLALAIGIVLAGHIGKALNNPGARRGMRTGHVERHWAEREHPRWLDEEERRNQ